MNAPGNEERLATCQAPTGEHLKPGFSDRENAAGKPAPTTTVQVKGVTDVVNAPSEVANAGRDPERRAGDQVLAWN